jgi:hypothetical protein
MSSHIYVIHVTEISLHVKDSVCFNSNVPTRRNVIPIVYFPFVIVS